MRGLLISLGITLVGLSQRLAHILPGPLTRGLVPGTVVDTLGVVAFKVTLTASAFMIGTGSGFFIGSVAENHIHFDLALGYNDIASGYNDFHQSVFPNGLLGGYGNRAAIAPVWIVVPASTVPYGQDCLPGLLGRPVETLSSADSDIAKEAVEFTSRLRKLVDELDVPLIGSGAHSLTVTTISLWSFDSPSEIYSSDTFALLNLTDAHSNATAPALDFNDVTDLPLVLEYLVYTLYNIKAALFLVVFAHYGLRREFYRTEGPFFSYTWPILMGIDAFAWLRFSDLMYDDCIRWFISGLRWILWAWQDELVRPLLLAFLYQVRSFISYCVIVPLAICTLFFPPRSRVHNGLSILCFLASLFWLFFAILLHFIIASDIDHRHHP